MFVLHNTKLKIFGSSENNVLMQFLHGSIRSGRYIFICNIYILYANSNPHTMYVELYYSFFVVDCMSILCAVMGIGYLKIGFLGTQINLLQTVVVVPWIFQIMENPIFGYYT